MKFKWEILSYCITTKEKTKRKESFYLHDLVLLSFPKLHLTLKRREGEILKVNYNFSQLKLYVEEKTADTGVGTTELTVAVDKEQLIQEPAPLWSVTRLIVGILFHMNW